MRLSLRAKGFLAFIALVAYLSVVGIVLGRERQKLLELAVELEQIYAQESTLNRVVQALNHSLLRMQTDLHGDGVTASAGDDIALDLELVQSGLRGFRRYSPRFDGDIERLGRQVSALRESVTRGALVALLDTEHDLSTRLGEASGELGKHRGVLWETYHRVYDRMTLLAVTMNLFGALVVGALVTLFFTRLAWDIRKLEARAMQVVEGYRGAQLEVTRQDEVGGLMEALNRMQALMRQREGQLEFSREQRFHHEKMAAVGSLATAVAHEINNPIAAIAGIAQSMRDARPRPPAQERRLEIDGPEMILEQTERISAISRQIAEFTRPHSPEPELLDLNALVRNTCKFISYDHRLRAVDVILELDAAMPALNAIADHVTQVLMNLAINSADALQGLPDRKPAIRVSTGTRNGDALLKVSDNGHGMEAAILARAFEEGFSTKPAGSGRGLGLFLCKMLIEGDGGRIEMESTPGIGTTATVRMPLPPRTIV